MKKIFLYILCILLFAGICQAQTTIKITELTEDTNPTSDDLTITVNSPGGSPANRKVTLGNLGKGLSAVDATKIADGSVSNAEFQYLDGVTSAIQTQINGKSATGHIHAASDITSGAFNATIIADGSISNIEFQYLDGVTSAIQTQLNGKSATTHLHDSDYISIIGTPTSGNFPIITAGGELQNSAYAPASFAASSHAHAASDTTSGTFDTARIPDLSATYVPNSLYDAHSILQATSDNTPTALVIAEQKIVGRATGGNIAALDIDSDLSGVSANDDTIPSAKAAKAYSDTKSSLGHIHAAADITSGAFNATIIADGSVSNTEFQYLDGVTSAIQTQINGKSATTHLHDSDYISIIGTPISGNFPTITAGGEIQNSVYAPASFAASSHQHSGADVTSGTVGATYLPSNSSSSAGIVLSGAAQVNMVWKTDAAGNPGWRADSTGGSPSFDTIATGENVTATMTVGVGGTLTYNSTGIVNASQFRGVTSVDAAEFGYLDGVTSDIQTQINGKSATTHNHDTDYISIIGTPTSGNFATITAGGELQNSAYAPASFAASSHQHSGADVTSGTVGATYLPSNSSSSAGIVLSGAAQVNMVWKTDAAGNPGWRADSTGGSPSFDTIATGENVTATMTVGVGGTLTYASTGIVNANQFHGVTSVDSAEFGYLDGATSNIQTQIDGKASSVHDHDSAYISIIGSPTAGNFPTITAGGELQNSSYGPASFSTVGHTHTSSGITDFNEASQDSVGGILTDTATIDFTYNDAGNQITAAVITDTSVQKIDIRKNTGGTNVGSRRRLNFIEGSNVTITAADDGTDNEIDITIAAPGVSGYTTIQEEGTPITQRINLNFVGSGLTAADDAGNTRTNVSLDATLNALADLTITDVSIIEGTGTDAFNVVASGGNNYFLGSNSDNSALEFKTPAATLTAIGGQPLDATLTALAGLTIADVSIIEGTAADTFNIVTSGGNNYFLGSNSDNTVLEFKTPAATLTAIGGQPLDATLTAFAGLTIADVSIIEGTAADTFNIVTSGGNDYFLGSNSGNTALEFKTPAATLTAIGGQPLDATLTALAGLTIADVSIIEGTAADTFNIVTSGGALRYFRSNSDNTALEFAAITQDDIGDGSTYQRVAAADVDAANHVNLVQDSDGTGAVQFTGLSETRSYTLPDAAATILTTNAAVTVAQGGTGLASGTEGGIPWYTTTTAMASSALLAQYGVMIGGGIDAAPSTIAASTTTTHTIFATAGAPAFRAIAAGDLPTALTPASVLATGIIDGLTNITINTGTTITVGGAGKLSGVYLNQHATPATAVAANLPVASAGQTHIVKNSHGAGGANTGVLTVHPVTGSTINHNGTNCAASQNLVSGGAAGDYIAIVGVDATHWEVVGYKGTWTCTTP